MAVERIGEKETSVTYSDYPVNGKCDEVQERPVRFVLCGVKMMSLHAMDISDGYWPAYSPVFPAIVGLRDPLKRSSETQSPSGREGGDGGHHPRALGNGVPSDLFRHSRLGNPGNYHICWDGNYTRLHSIGSLNICCAPDNYT